MNWLVCHTMVEVVQCRAGIEVGSVCSISMGRNISAHVEESACRCSVLLNWRCACFLVHVRPSITHNKQRTIVARSGGQYQRAKPSMLLEAYTRRHQSGNSRPTSSSMLVCVSYALQNCASLQVARVYGHKWSVSLHCQTFARPRPAHLTLEAEARSGLKHVRAER